MVEEEISSDWQWYGMRRDLCFALSRKEAISGGRREQVGRRGFYTRRSGEEKAA